MHILVVEDEPDVAELLRRSLELLGNTCVHAADTAEAERLLDPTINALTLDLSMPGRGGLDWLEEIARERPDLARRTLVITGVDLETEAIDRLVDCGAGVLAKPFTIAHLADAVRSQLSHSGSGRAD